MSEAEKTVEERIVESDASDYVKLKKLFKAKTLPRVIGDMGMGLILHSVGQKAEIPLNDGPYTDFYIEMGLVEHGVGPVGKRTYQWTDLARKLNYRADMKWIDRYDGDTVAGVEDGSSLCEMEV